MVNTQFGSKIQRVRNDNDAEFTMGPYGSSFLKKEFYMRLPMWILHNKIDGLSVKTDIY